MRIRYRMWAALAALASPAVAGELPTGFIAAFWDWSLSVPTTHSIVLCHGYGCTDRTEIALTAADRPDSADHGLG